MSGFISLSSTRRSFTHSSVPLLDIIRHLAAQHHHCGSETAPEAFLYVPACVVALSKRLAERRSEWLTSLWAASSCGKDHTSIQSGYILLLSLEHSGEGAIAPCHTYSKALSLGSSCS